MSNIRTGIKMRVTPEQSKRVQEICFANVIGWASGKGLKHLNNPHLYINIYGELGYTNKDSELYFIEDDREEVSAELFIRTDGTCIEPEVTTENNNKGEQMEEINELNESFVEDTNMEYTKVELRSKSDGKLYKGVLIREFNIFWLLVDFETYARYVELSKYDFDTLFDESYIDFLNREYIL